MAPIDRLSPDQVKLLKEGQIAALATIMPDGSPHVAPVRVDVEPDGTHILINTSVGSTRFENLNRNPRVSLTVIDSENDDRRLTVRGTAVEKLGPDQGETRVVFRIKPTDVLVNEGDQAQ